MSLHVHGYMHACSCAVTHASQQQLHAVQLTWVQRHAYARKGHSSSVLLVGFVRQGHNDGERTGGADDIDPIG